MVIQRKTKNLGLNRSRDKEKIYRHIEKVLGITEKKCGMTRVCQYGFKHSGRNPLPIRNFNLLNVNIDNGKVIIKSKDGLQTNCMSCERKYRAGRIAKNKKKYSDLTDEEIYEEYKKNYRELKVCSRCKQDKKTGRFSNFKRNGNWIAQCLQSMQQSLFGICWGQMDNLFSRWARSH